MKRFQVLDCLATLLSLVTKVRGLKGGGYLRGILKYFLAFVFESVTLQLYFNSQYLGYALTNSAEFSGQKSLKLFNVETRFYGF